MAYPERTRQARNALKEGDYLTGVVVAVVGVSCAGIIVGAGFVIAHFVAKFW